MKVLAAIIVPPHLAVSGASRAAEKLSLALARHCDIDIAGMGVSGCPEIPDGALPARARRVPVRVGDPLAFTTGLLPNRARTLFYRSDIPARIRRGGYDLVHLHNPVPALEMRRVARACRAVGVPYVLSTHGFVEIGDPAAFRPMGWAERLVWDRLVDRPVREVVRHAARIFAISPVDRPIVEAFGYRDRPVDIVPYGVDRPDLSDGPGAADHAVRQRFDLGPPGDPACLTAFFLANHTRNKGLDILLRAFTALDRPYRLIVGGERRDFVDYDLYAQRCRPGQRIIHTGHLRPDEVSTLFRCADLFVFPTLADTFPNVVLEAMAHAVPVVATRVGGIPHQVTEDCGVLVPPGDPAALAAAVEKLAGQPEIRRRMGQQGRRRVEREFDWARSAEATFGGYRMVIAGTSRAAAPTPLPLGGTRS